MCAAPKYDPNSEIFVRREAFDRYFAKPIPKATFFRWVNEGKVKKARDLDGWYLLNKTLVHQGMQPVDVTEFQKSREALHPAVRLQQLLYIAVASTSHLYHNFLEESPFLDRLPEALSQDDLTQIQQFQKDHAEAGKDFDYDSFRQMAYQAGCMDALVALFEAQQGLDGAV